MFRALARLLRNIGHVITFGLISASRPIEQNPQIVGMEYDDIIRDKAKAAQRIKDAVGGLMAQQTSAEEKIKRLTADVESLEQERAGASALAKERAERLRSQGKSQQEILQDGEFTQYQSAFNDASSTLEEKKGRVQDLEGQVETLQQAIDSHIIQAQEMAREVERLRSEKHETVAGMEAARQIDGINEALAGISTSGIDDRLSELRRRRDEAMGKAKASQRVAGTDVKLQREKLRRAARASGHSKEFLEAVGMGGPAMPEAEKPSEEAPQDDAKLPE